jgi:ribonuclease R
MSSSFKDSASELKKAVVQLLDNSPQLLTKLQIIKILGIKGRQKGELEYVLYHLKQGGSVRKVTHRKPLNPTQPLPPPRRRRNSEILIKHSFTRVGLFLNKNGRARLVSCHRKDPYPPVAYDLETLPEIPNEYVVAYHVKTNKKIHVEKILGSIHNPKTYSLMAIYSHELRHVFSNEALKLAQQGKVPSLEGRTDFRDFSLLTIDGDDAKDFDDAVWAAPDSDPRNPGGWQAIVAIADVSYYVRPEDALDKEAHERGNSVYFADRVVPMLPEALSNEMCSLKPNQDRACLAVEMVVSADGKIKSHRFKRGLMRSKARLTYTQVQQAIQGDHDEITGPLWSKVLQPLYGVYQSLLKARRKRGTLDLNIPERKIIFNSGGQIAEVIEQERFESHQLIEELMVAANVCSAQTLLAKKFSTLFRIHDLPEATRVENLKTVLKSLKVQLPKVKAFRPAHFQTILNKVQDSPYRQLVNDLVLRSQSQANYSPHNVGHFGLSLTHYCHFTSPIRRYADLIVHRGLIKSLSLGHDGQDYPLEVLEVIGQHISQTERKAVLAEREVNDRLITAFLETHIGEVYSGAIVGVTGAGIFISLNDNGAEGFISKSRLPYDYYRFDEANHRYIGQRTKRVYQLGQPVVVRLEAADPTSCSTTFSILEEEPLKNRPNKKDKSKPKDKRKK